MSHAEHKERMIEALRADSAAAWDKCEERRLQAVELVAALQPFAWLAEVAHPSAVDALLGPGFYQHLQKAKAVLAKVQA